MYPSRFAFITLKSLIMAAADNVTNPRIRFILDGTIVSVKRPDPTMTVLQYLRGPARRPGCKEGCAEGDCGACTVVVGEAVNGRLRLRSVNACILLLPMLHGKLLLTVESLKPHQTSPLHPVQRAMVDCHGSQCGFCTPGFVMSLFALFKHERHPDRARINDALSGNLCRCTGYRPIIEAARRMYEPGIAARDDWMALPATAQQPIEPAEQALLALLDEIDEPATLHLQNEEQDYFAPHNADSLAAVYQQHPDATLIAGNTDVGLWINKQLRQLPKIISLAAVRDLRHIDIDDQFITIGAMVAVSDAFATLQEFYPELEDLCRRWASMPVRNAATLVGNIANGSPIGDSMPVLLALQAEITLRLGDQQRRLPLDQFYLGYQHKDLKPGEWIESVSIPLNRHNYQVASYKVSKRYDQDISAVCAAFVLGFDDQGCVDHLRIAYGGMAAIPQRALRAEQALRGKTWDAAHLESAKAGLEQDFKPLSDMRASSGYRQRVASNLLHRFFLATRADAPLLSLDQLPQVVR